PKGDFLVCTTWGGGLYVLETSTGKQRYFMRDKKTWFGNPVFHKEKNLFACHRKTAIEIREVGTGKLLRTIKNAHEFMLKPHDGKFLVGTDPRDSDAFKIWDWTTPRERVHIKMNRALEEGQSDQCYLAFSPDGKSVVTSGTHSPLEMW